MLCAEVGYHKFLQLRGTGTHSSTHSWCSHVLTGLQGTRSPNPSVSFHELRQPYSISLNLQHQARRKHGDEQRFNFLPQFCNNTILRKAYVIPSMHPDVCGGKAGHVRPSDFESHAQRALDSLDAKRLNPRPFIRGISDGPLGHFADHRYPKYDSCLTRGPTVASDWVDRHSELGGYAKDSIVLLTLRLASQRFFGTTFVSCDG